MILPANIPLVELTNKYGWCGPQGETQVTVLGADLRYQNWGMCYSHRVKIYKGNQLVYVWDKELNANPDSAVKRKELFFGGNIPSRTYQGNQPCFLEILQSAHDTGRIPKLEDIPLIEPEYYPRYIRFLERIINQ